MEPKYFLKAFAVTAATGPMLIDACKKGNQLLQQHLQPPGQPQSKS